MIMYLFIFFIGDLYFFKKYNTSNTHNAVTVSILQSLNSCLQDVQRWAEDDLRMLES